MNGLLAGLAPRYGLRGICLLATTSGSDPVDIAAAGRLLAAIEKLLNLELDLSVLSPFGEEQEIETPSEIDMNYR